MLRGFLHRIASQKSPFIALGGQPPITDGINRIAFAQQTRAARSDLFLDSVRPTSFNGCAYTMNDLVNAVNAPPSPLLLKADGVCDGSPMARRTGRPVRPSLGVWRHADVLTQRVRTIVGQRDDEQTVTDVGRQLVRLARRIVAHPLTESQYARLLKLAPKAKPSRIVRTLLSWRFEMSDWAVREALHRSVPGRVDKKESLAEILEIRWRWRRVADLTRASAN